MDKSLIDDDEIDVKTIDLGESVHVMYVKNKKKHHVPEPEYEYENIDENSCFSVFKRSPFE